MSDSNKISPETANGKIIKTHPFFKLGPMRKQQLQHQTTAKARKVLFTSTKKLITGLCILASVTALSFAAAVLLATTDVFHSAVMQRLRIVNNTETYDFWRQPPVQPLLKVTVFNYTNVAEFEAGTQKIRVQEVGPYTYRQTTERVNIRFNGNGTVSYQEKRAFEFIPELSTGQPRDRVVVLNVPLMSSVSVARDQMYMIRLSIAAVLSGLRTKTFLRMPVKDLLWGYDDSLFTLGKGVTVLREEVPFDQFGLLVARDGVSRDTVTVHTGENGLQSLGIIDRYNGASRVNYWSGDECNRIDGSDGSLFPPHMVTPDSRIHIYNGDMCRRLPLEFKERVKVLQGIPALRFHPPRDVFSPAEHNPENACYCHVHTETCPPAGVFNASPCAFGAPVMLSFPHFFLGDKQLLDTVDGLSPDPEKHDTYIDLHEKLGIPMGGKSRFQINMMVRKAKGISYLDKFPDGSILPIAWMEMGVDDLPPEVTSMLYMATFGVQNIRLAMLYVSVAVALLSAAVLAYCLYSHRLKLRQVCTDMSSATPTARGGDSRVVLAVA